MKQVISNQNKKNFGNSIEHLLKNTKKWSNEISFIKVEQGFLKELLGDHIISLCETNNFKKAKLLLNGIEHEEKLSIELLNSIEDHSINLSLLYENIYLKREDNFRNNHEFLRSEVQNYLENFNYIKEQVFELVLFILKKEKERKLLN